MVLLHHLFLYFDELMFEGVCLHISCRDRRSRCGSVTLGVWRSYPDRHSRPSCRFATSAVRERGICKNTFGTWKTLSLFNLFKHFSRTRTAEDVGPYKVGAIFYHWLQKKIKVFNRRFSECDKYVCTNYISWMAKPISLRGLPRKH